MPPDLSEIRRRVAVAKAGSAAVAAYRAEQTREREIAELRARIAAAERKDACAREAARIAADFGTTEAEREESARAHQERFLRDGTVTAYGCVGHPPAAALAGMKAIAGLGG